LSETRLKLEPRRTSQGVMLKVRLTPKSSRDAIVGVEEFGGEAVLKARVRAVPEDGRANAALEKLIARWLKLPPSSVSVARGGTSRIKQIMMGGDIEMLVHLIAASVAELESESR
jgi:uncharacterized protein (TIGR00251 family)